MNNRNLFNELRAYRQKQQLTIREASERSGLLPSTIWRLETGKSAAYLNSFLAYAKGLDLEIILQPKAETHK